MDEELTRAALKVENAAREYKKLYEEKFRKSEILNFQLGRNDIGIFICDSEGYKHINDLFFESHKFELEI